MWGQEKIFSSSSIGIGRQRVSSHLALPQRHPLPATVAIKIRIQPFIYGSHIENMFTSFTCISHIKHKSMGIPFTIFHVWWFECNTCALSYDNNDYYALLPLACLLPLPMCVSSYISVCTVRMLESCHFAHVWMNEYFCYAVGGVDGDGEGDDVDRYDGARWVNAKNGSERTRHDQCGNEMERYIR